jgi:hypothetical protein
MNILASTMPPISRASPRGQERLSRPGLAFAFFDTLTISIGYDVDQPTTISGI